MFNIWRYSAGPAREEAEQGVQCQAGASALAAPLHAGQQPIFGGHQETLSSARVKASSTEALNRNSKEGSKKEDSIKEPSKEAESAATNNWGLKITMWRRRSALPAPSLFILNGCWPDIDDSIIFFGVAEKHTVF